MARCLGKGEADSSILSGSTRNPHLFLDTDDQDAHRNALLRALLWQIPGKVCSPPVLDRRDEMTERYQLMITGPDVRESAMFLAKAVKRRDRKGMDAKQAFFVVLSSFTIALAEAMRQAKFDEQEMASIMHQAVDGGLNAQDVSVN